MTSTVHVYSDCAGALIMTMHVVLSPAVEVRAQPPEAAATAESTTATLLAGQGQRRCDTPAVVSSHRLLYLYHCSHCLMLLLHSFDGLFTMYKVFISVCMRFVRGNLKEICCSVVDKA